MPEIISHLKDQQTRLVAPQKKPRGKKLADDQKYYNRLVRSIHQPVESLFNVNSKPIVADPTDAFRTFYSSNLDMLYFGSARISK